MTSALHVDMLELVFEFLPGSTLILCARVCWFWHKLANRSRLWELLCKNKGAKNLQDATSKYFAGNQVLVRQGTTPNSFQDMYKRLVLWHWDAFAKGPNVQLTNKNLTISCCASEENEWQAVRASVG